MNCDEIRKAIREKKAAIMSRNAKYAGWQYGAKTAIPEEIRNFLVNERGMDPAAVDAALASSPGHAASQEEALKASENLADKALTNASQVQPDPNKPVNRAKIGQMWEAARDAINKGVARAFNSIPKHGGENLKKALRSMAENKVIMKLDEKGNYAGSFKGTHYSALVNELYKTLKPQVKMGFDHFDEALSGFLHMRGEDAGKYIPELRDRIEAKITDNPILKQTATNLNLTEQIAHLPEVKAFAEKYYNDLDAAQSYMINKGLLRESFDSDGKLLPAGRKDYMHNNVALHDYQDGYDKFFKGDKLSFSNPTQAKKYRNGWEAQVEASAMPASRRFTHTSDSYWKSLVNAGRFTEMANTLRNNAELQMSHPDKFLIHDNLDSASPAIVARDASNPNWEIPKGYKELVNSGDGIGRKFNGLYAHPELYGYFKSVFSMPKPDGLASWALKKNGQWKGVIFSMGSIYHAGSLYRKTQYLGTRTGNNFWRGISIQGEGLSAVANNDPKLLRAVQNGLGIHTEDLLRTSAFQKKYNEAGDQTAMSSVAEKIHKFTDMQERWLFQKWHLGVKAGTFLRALESDYFNDPKTGLKAKYGGDTDLAMQKMADMWNDHYGARNLEAIGRSAYVQRVMQATLLAPDWTESKMRRLFGTVLANDPEVRKTYRWSLAAQGALVVTTQIIAQMLHDKMYDVKNPRTIADIFTKDIFNGHFGSIYLGQTRDAKPKDKYLKAFGSESQDFNPIIKMVKAMGEVKTDPFGVPRVIVKEALNKASPALRLATNINANIKSKEPAWSKTIRPFMPIGASGAVGALAGEMGGKDQGERNIEAVKQLASSAVGMPIVAYSHKKEGKSAKGPSKSKKSLKVMR